MKNSALVSIIIATALPLASNAPDCRDFQGGFCVDAGSEGHGLVITRGGTIEFEFTAEGLQLIVNDKRSGAETILNLPGEDRK